ncbi:uncharacterized protein LOC117170525 [Belonocnema kinseyi]|uniref:uncharacterized protein LOC117170525 n=1 Tax=Belonocnema kinseyi TaxID=2817044 RepID=UPI00143DCCC0|nr:uncharacterized protein LOC117170525 [Belonocnema kinseyi]
MHGNLGSSADWVVTGPSNGLAFLLADSGYDVWLGNNRGNTYSKNHTIFLETSYGFWDFRFPWALDTECHIFVFVSFRLRSEVKGRFHAGTDRGTRKSPKVRLGPSGCHRDETSALALNKIVSALLTDTGHPAATTLDDSTVYYSYETIRNRECLLLEVTFSKEHLTLSQPRKTFSSSSFPAITYKQ